MTGGNLRSTRGDIHGLSGLRPGPDGMVGGRPHRRSAGVICLTARHKTEQTFMTDFTTQKHCSEKI